MVKVSVVVVVVVTVLVLMMVTLAVAVMVAVLVTVSVTVMGAGGPGGLGGAEAHAPPSRVVMAPVKVTAWPPSATTLPAKPKATRPERLENFMSIDGESVVQLW